uniref:Uncharacterized protein n=1 Tax=Schistosoma mansoni TaxID=6183 RepID=A0A5K4F3L2_SCHMA
MALSGFSDFDELSSCETLLYHNGLSAISFTHVFDRKKTDLCSQSLHTSDVPSRKTRSSVIMDDEKSVTSNSRLVLPHSKPSFRVNHEDRLMLADSFLSPDAHPAAVRKLRGRRRRGKQNLSNCSSISPLRLDQSGLLQTSSFESNFLCSS